jgi:chlorobactene glucosyltransferase
MNVLDAVVLVVSGALVAISGILLLNVWLFPRLGRGDAWTGAWPRVSVLIPARDEAAVIEQTVRALDGQDYPDLEIIVLDDHSGDGTGALARAVGGRVRVIDGVSLPEGWAGKNWACHQLAEAASGDVLVFTDADVRWESGALRALVGQMQAARADLMTVWPTQTTVTWGERLVVPLMALVVLAYLPVVGVHYVPLAMFGAANGQCMAWRRQAYQQVGGHGRVRDNVLEDVTLARLVKAAGLRLWMADGDGLIGCRMYQDWNAVRRGYAKNIIAGYGGVLPLLLAAVFHWAVFLFPWGWLMLGGGWLALALGVNGLLLRMLTAAWTRQRVLDGLLMPVSVLLMTVIAGQALYWQWRFGGPVWKGRVVRRAGVRA